jgi:BirA family biotin operon repressor/biotin-[acetyl-CoA-carboxylase] ligase
VAVGAGRPGIPVDLQPRALAPLLGGRMLRVYPAVLSTEADAQAWARAGGPDGGLVIAGYQVSPRGRSGLEWQVRQGIDLAFSVVLRPELSAQDEGWLYTVITSALADVLGRGAGIHWPDEVHGAQGRLAAVGVHAELGAGQAPGQRAPASAGPGAVGQAPGQRAPASAGPGAVGQAPGQRAPASAGPGGIGVVTWAVASVLLADVPALASREGVPEGRGPLLARVLEAVDARRQQPRDQVLDDYRSRCATFGRDVRARLIPLGPAGPVIVGRAVDAARDGALVLDSASGRRVAVRPQHLGVLEPAEHEEVEPQEISERGRPDPRAPGGGPAPR